ncbi:metal-dependent hydrolase [Fodinibius halophilus]|uniref:Metal-dependent hydrolase n=1 Tax=Fodinibius halophilus TaxID=1736908 RepID=A0A6M1T348_9BACT|nr:metal-dependent hydrolase [Fodinibius halophilus]NGP87043.1 metal-dependent hydrolase [Fodinibius halophilus]
MDTVTQITLGAAVGELVLGKKIGNKAPLWGAIFGVVPDLDVLASPFVSEVQALAIHRGFSHSLFFCAIAAPLFGWLLHRYYKQSETSLRDWSLLVFMTIITHIFIDVCTSYGTQVFQPFSNYSLSFNSIFIIDPFYTLPLMAGILTALFLKRNTAKRKWANTIGLAISSLYLLLGFGVKAHVNDVFEQNFTQQDIHPQKYMTTPAPFSIFLWTGYAEEGDRLYAGLYSVFDDDRTIDFKSIQQNAELLKPYEGQLPVERLKWFSQGYYAASKNTPTLLVHDLRFGRSDLWLTDETAPFVWNYRLIFNEDSTQVVGFEQYEPSFDMRSEVWSQLFDRVFGKE